MYRTIYDAREFLLPDWSPILIGVSLVAAGIALWAVGKLDQWLWSPRRIEHESIPVDLPAPMLARQGFDRLTQARYFRRFGLVGFVKAGAVSS